MEEAFGIIESTIKQIDKQFYNSNVYFIKPNDVNIVIENNGNFAQLFQSIYDKHYVPGDKIIEQTKDKVILICLYLFNELLMGLHDKLLQKEIYSTFNMNFRFNHSTYWQIEHKQILDTTKNREEYIKLLK